MPERNVGERSEALVGLMAEAYRMRLLCGLEDMLASAGYTRVAGVDEAGRGCLAGPVVSAAVVVEPGTWIPGVDDSKKLKHGQRERIAEEIYRRAAAVSWVAVEADVIDRINILEATRLSMQRALLDLEVVPDVALVDAVVVRDLPFPSLPVIRGDSFSFAVAAASIIAKTERDRIMRRLGRKYPGYGLGENKGYAARKHRDALAAMGPTPAHRLTFRSVIPRSESAKAEVA